MLQQLYKSSAHSATHTASTMWQPNTYNRNTLPAALPKAVNSNNAHMHGSHTHSAKADTKTDKMPSRLASGLGPHHHHQTMQPLPSSKTESSSTQLRLTFVQLLALHPLPFLTLQPAGQSRSTAT